MSTIPLVWQRRLKIAVRILSMGISAVGAVYLVREMSIQELAAIAIILGSIAFLFLMLWAWLP